MSQQGDQKRYLLLDGRDAPLARGQLESPPDAPSLQVRVLDGKIDAVLAHEVVQLISASGELPPLAGRIVRSRGDVIVLEKQQELGAAARQNLRMPTQFRSFIYPLSGGWKGRREVVANDLSCGGISFFSGWQLETGERLEIVVPITAEPLVLRCQILRRLREEQDRILYAAKFVDMCNDEETYVREAVFGIQLDSRPR